MNKSDSGVNRVRDFIGKNKINSEVIEFDVSTRNSQLAAQALNCPVGQIAISIIFIVNEPLVVKSLQRFDEVYAAAGSPNAVFKIGFEELRSIACAEVVDVSV